jgi:uncharacterized protein (TIGR03435 family)
MTLICWVIAQTGVHAKFEVASVKQAAPNAQGMSVVPGPGGGINITNVTLKQLMTIAFSVQPFQISGGPAWLDSAQYDIVAKPETRPKQDETRLMIQSLLEERFQLVFHRETKEGPVFAMVLARKDGKLGSSLVQSKEGGCTLMDPSSPVAVSARSCGWMLMSGPSFEATSIPLANMLPMLSRYLGHPVIDKTGLNGKFDISVHWGPDYGGARAGRGNGGQTATSDTSIFTAFQEASSAESVGNWEALGSCLVEKSPELPARRIKRALLRFLAVI